MKLCKFTIKDNMCNRQVIVNMLQFDSATESTVDERMKTHHV